MNTIDVSVQHGGSVGVGMDSGSSDIGLGFDSQGEPADITIRRSQDIGIEMTRGTEEISIELDSYGSGGGGGGEGTMNYPSLYNKPSINGVVLVGDKTSAELGIEGEENVIEAITVNEEPQPVVEKTVALFIPENNSELYNDSGYITDADIVSLTNLEIEAMLT